MAASIFKKEGIDLYIDTTCRIKHPEQIEIGNHVAIDMGVYLSTSSNIGDYVHIAPYSCIIGGVDSKLIMEEFSGISAGCKILCGSDDYLSTLLIFSLEHIS